MLRAVQLRRDSGLVVSQLCLGTMNIARRAAGAKAVGPCRWTRRAHAQGRRWTQGLSSSTALTAMVAREEPVRYLLSELAGRVSPSSRPRYRGDGPGAN
jgi:hypothetical protein